MQIDKQQFMENPIPRDYQEIDLLMLIVTSKIKRVHYKSDKNIEIRTENKMRLKVRTRHLADNIATNKW